MKYRLFITRENENAEFDVYGPIPRIGEHIAWNEHYYTVINVSYAISYKQVTLVAVSVR